MNVVSYGQSGEFLYHYTLTQPAVGYASAQAVAASGCLDRGLHGGLHAVLIASNLGHARPAHPCGFRVPGRARRRIRDSNRA
jgi:hypothetical protein